MMTPLDGPDFARTAYLGFFVNIMGNDPNYGLGTTEGYFSIFKRGMKGIYQHCGEKHLHRYLAEFDFRYNHRSSLGCGDIERTIAAVKDVEGKHLMDGIPIETLWRIAVCPIYRRRL